ncbi:MAG TPA: AtzH-like domain-containing protein [Acidimicrobiales bacterium]|nr:AtzH-like domain-containing protein [Acidimicrobiales bacterium]
MRGLIEDERAIADDVRHCFFEYEAALVAQDHTALDQWFWDDPRVVRFGISEIQYGARAVAEWRRGSPHVGDDRALRNVQVLVLGPDLAVVSTEFVRDDRALLGRQTQVWARIDGQWRIAHAHVSHVDTATCAETGQPIKG